MILLIAESGNTIKNVMYDTFAISSLITAIGSWLLAFFVYGKKRGDITAKSFFIMCLSVGVWAICLYMRVIATEKSIAFFWTRLLYIGSILIPVSILQFVLDLLNLRNKNRKILYIAYGFVLLFTPFIFTNLFIRDIAPKLSFRFWDVPGPLYPLFTLYYNICVFYSGLILVREHKIAAGYKKNQIRYAIAALIIGVIGGSTTFLPVFNIPVFPYGNYLVVIYIFIFAYAILKYRLMDIRLAVTRTGIFVAVYALTLGFPFWIGYHTKSWVWATSFMAGLATIGPIVHRMLQRKAENILLARQKRYQRALLNAGKGMVREHDLNRLLKLISYVIKAAVRIEFVAAFMKENDEDRYDLRVARGLGSLPDDFTISGDHFLVETLKKKKGPLLYEEVNTPMDGALGKAIHLIIPSFINDKLLAFIVLGEKKDKTFYTEEDIGVFKILSHQASLAIENCMFVDETKEAQAKLFQAEKLASIGGMADGVAHQMKNRLNHFSIASGEMQFEIADFKKNHQNFVDENPDLQKTFDYLTKIAESLLTNVKRTNAIIQGILNYARVEEKDTFFGEFSMREIIDLSIELLQIKHEIGDFPLEVEIECSDMIYGVKAQIMEAIYNVLDNCYEAVVDKMQHHLSDEERDAFVPMIHFIMMQSHNLTVIGISDNGIGIKEEDSRKVFAPFFTTKSSYKSGSGIGMYVVKRMVEENHKGKIVFESEHMIGTKFVIELPRKKIS